MSRDRFTPSRYHKLPLHAKQRHALGSAREHPVRCSACWTQLVQSDVPNHERERCAGSVEARDAMIVGRRKP